MADKNMFLFRSALFVTGALSIGSLLLYFYGLSTFGALSLTMSSIEVLSLGGLGLWASRLADSRPLRLLVSALCSGCIATLAYDIVRVPLVHSGTPVFKAISYFGTALLGQDRPSTLSDFVGWLYHLSNGVSFGMMYAALVPRPGPITAVCWGLALEGGMLLTPYAEIFGYQRDTRFLAITIGSHAVYGLALWLGLRGDRLRPSRLQSTLVGAVIFTVLFGVAAIAADFNRLYSRKISQSPPPYVGSHLYTAWNVPEPDRIAAMWVMRRFIDPQARFHFIDPFDKVKFGQPFDMPEAAVRRSGTRSATQVLLDRYKQADPRLAALAHTTELTEITPWMLPSDPNSARLAQRLQSGADSHCGRVMMNSCLGPLFDDLDRWYAEPGQ